MSLKSPFLDAALAAANAEFHVFPIRPGSKKPPIKEWQKIATSDVKVVRHLWVDRPNANIGIMTGGKLRLFVIDVDGDAGRQSLKRLTKKFGPLPPTVKVHTPRGYHHYFRCDKRLRNNTGKLGVGLDGRGEGGYVVGAGSICFGTNGESLRYRYAKGRSPDEIEIAEIPRWLQTALKVGRADPQTSSSNPESGIPTSYASKALWDEAAAVRRAPEGTRNDRVNTAAFNMG